MNERMNEREAQHLHLRSFLFSTIVQREKTARTEERGGGGGKEWEEGEEGKEEEKEMRASWRKKKGREEGKKGKMRTKVRGENAENRKMIKKR